jgi:hypothetical protein
LADDLAARQADAIARQFDFTDRNEMKQWGQSVNQKMAMIQEYEQDKAISRFFTQHPDFPGSDQANDALGQIIDERGWEVNADNLEMAHLIAVQRICTDHSARTRYRRLMQMLPSRFTGSQLRRCSGQITRRLRTNLPIRTPCRWRIFAARLLLRN